MVWSRDGTCETKNISSFFTKLLDDLDVLTSNCTIHHQWQRKDIPPNDLPNPLAKGHSLRPARPAEHVLNDHQLVVQIDVNS